MSEPTLDVAGIFDRASAEYDHTGVAFFTPLGARLAERAAIVPGESVLDLGCGRGACLFPAARATGPGGSVLGLDVAPGMVRATAADLEREGIRHAEVRVADAMALDDLSAASFDVAVSGLVLFFVPEPPVAVASLHRLLRPGGRLAFSSFAGRDERWQVVSELLVAFGGTAAQPPGAAHFGSDASVHELLATGGFVDAVSEVVDVEAVFADAEAWERWSRSHFQRAAFETIPAAHRAEAVAAARELVEGLRGPDGRLAQRYRVRFTTAHRPG